MIHYILLVLNKSLGVKGTHVHYGLKTRVTVNKSIVGSRGRNFTVKFYIR